MNLLQINRGSSGTYVDINGTLRTAGSNVPRFDHDPITGEPLGILLEAPATNQLTFSESFITSNIWPRVRLNIQADAFIAPDGRKTATRIFEDTSANTSHYITRTVNAAANTRVVFSIFARAAERSAISLQINNTSRIDVDLKTGEYRGADNTDIDIKVIPFRNGWYRISTTYQNVVASNFPVQIFIKDSYLNNSNNYEEAATGDQGIYIWGAQFETNFLTSYINTANTTRTRSVEYLVSELDQVDFDFKYGTMFISCKYINKNRALINTMTYPVVTIIPDTGDGIYLAPTDSKSHMTAEIVNGNITVSPPSVGDVEFGNKFLAAVTWDEELITAAGNGTATDPERHPNINFVPPTSFIFTPGVAALYIQMFRYTPGISTKEQLEAMTVND